MRNISIETTIHGRALLRDAAIPSDSKRLLVGFHGYAQTAEDAMAELERIPGAERWSLLSIEALHHFYSRHFEKVVASWMTRQDRELAIADNVRYVDRVMASVVGEAQDAIVVMAGFSQGAAMAYRAGVLGRYQPRVVVAIGGDVPPDIHGVSGSRFPAILLARGENDPLYEEEKAAADEQFLRSSDVRFDSFRYPGGHEWTPELCARIGDTLAAL